MTVKQVKKFLEEVEKETLVGFSINTNGDNAKENGYIVEGEYWSNLGEDVIISLVIEKPTIKEVIEEMYEVYYNFDPEEHAAELYYLYGEHGKPTSLRELLEDADRQAERLQEIYNIMQRLYNKN
jgi:hypothetical protein